MSDSRIYRINQQYEDTEMTLSHNITELAAVLNAAFRRSFTMTLPLTPLGGGVLVSCGAMSRWNTEKPFGKFLFLGPPPAELLPVLGLGRDASLPPLDDGDQCSPAAGELPYTESRAFVRYAEHPLHEGLAAHMHRRPCTRFDYTEEWNNLGFGRIRTNESIWAANGGFVAESASELAGIVLEETDGSEAYAGAYLTLYDTPNASLLWCARPAGPVDSTEWSVIERFISDWRADELPCLPCLLQVPAGYQCIVTMRLDCDEDIASARPLFNLYRDMDVPFSLAVKTSLPMESKHVDLINDVRGAGGSLVSHSHTHQVNWGPDYDAVREDARATRQWFVNAWPHLSPADVAVSPFHTNPPYAVRALAHEGFSGFVSGIIHNDPEYLLGRAGVVPFADKIVSISQQSMMHGDCYARQNSSVETHLLAFLAQYAARGIFGYLDHPFSDRYQYDWVDENQRLKAHMKLILKIKKYKGVLFWNQEKCFNFVRELAQVRIKVNPTDCIHIESGTQRKYDIMYRYKGIEFYDS